MCTSFLRQGRDQVLNRRIETKVEGPGFSGPPHQPYRERKERQVAIIDPEGLFGGERLAACSDLAQLYWPRLFLAANNLARLEMAYKPIASRVFGNFQRVPDCAELWAIFQEYSANFLAILYQSEGGMWWCQFITSAKNLPRHPGNRALASPAPPKEAIEAHQKGYLEWKRAKSLNCQSFQKISETFGNVPNFSAGVGVGVGVGVGLGVGVREAKPFVDSLSDNDPAWLGKDASVAVAQIAAESIEQLTNKPKRARKANGNGQVDPRYHIVIEHLSTYWKQLEGHSDKPFPMDAAQGKYVKDWLKGNPNLDPDTFWAWLENLYVSENTNPAWNVRDILSRIHRYADGPLDKFGRVQEAHRA